MGNKFFRSILIVISFLAASVGLASCGSTYTPSYDNLSFVVISEEEKICEVTEYKKYYNDERDNNIYIPKIWNDYKVTSIGESAFFGCESLSFQGCTSLSSIVIPKSVTSIGDDAFNGCTSLSSIVIPDSVTSIGNAAFQKCSSLSSVTIGNGVASIGEYAFSFCPSLSSIVIPDSVTSIGHDAFYDCASLSSVTIGNGVTSIGESAFQGCTSLSDVYYTGTKVQWNAISIDFYNDELEYATIHYNYVGK